MKVYLCGCGKKAQWCYIPATSKKWNPYFCDDCVPRGCSCNEEYDNDYDRIENTIKWYNERGVKWEWIEEGVSIRRLDDQGRKLPCVEYWFKEDGWEANEDEIREYAGDGVKLETT